MIPWFNLLQNPLSQFDQNVNPVTTWFSPKYTFNFKGSAQIEEQVQMEVASFGTQLGVLLDAVDELGADLNTPALNRLREMKSKVDAVKAQHHHSRLDELEKDLLQLKAQDSKAFKQLMTTVHQDTKTS